MSRVGKVPVTVPSGVKASVNNGLVLVEGPKGKLQFRVGTGVTVKSDNGVVTVERQNDEAQARANHGTTRATINTMILGVTKGWKRSLEFNGVGYNAKVAGSMLTLSVGFSHEVKMEIPQGIKATVTKNVLDLECADKELLGTFAANIRKVQPPEPYLGKGIKYTDETIRRKAGKTGKK